MVNYLDTNSSSLEVNHEAPTCKEMVNQQDKYSFLSKEIAKHPEMHQWTSEELLAKETDYDFWDLLSEQLDCLRICDACHRPMIEGFCIDGGNEHYCSEDCLHRFYTDEEYLTMYNNGNGDSYWTVWGE